MSGERQKLQEYITDTFYYIHTVKEFCSNFPQWKTMRKVEIEHMKDYNKSDDRLDIELSDAVGKNSKYTLGEYLTSKFKINTDSTHADLQKELDEVLNNTMEGLNELHIFLDAVEKLAVTSLYVFMENQVLHLPENINPFDVQTVIVAAQQICPLLLVFKRDQEKFFLPKFQNVKVLVHMLKKYLQTTEKICDKLDKSFFSNMDLEIAEKTSVEFDEALCENEKQKMVDRIKQLDEIRMDEDFRMVFLFQEVSCYGFIYKFRAHRTNMLEFLVQLEGCAVQLDRMCKGAKISSVTGSSVAAVGGVLSTVGLALSPVTAGVSLSLTISGAVMGAISGLTSAVTTATEIGVNYINQNEAKYVFQNFMKNIQRIQDCLEKVTNPPAANVEQSKLTICLGLGKVVAKGGTVGKCIDATIDAASALALKAEQVATSTSKVLAQEGKALRNIPKVASDVPDISQAAVKGPLALSKGARVGFIAANALFLGVDIFIICKDSVSLAKGSETKVSKFIRARAELWLLEVKSWEKLHDSLSKGLKTSGTKKAILGMQFYPDAVMERLEEEENVEEDTRIVPTGTLNGLASWWRIISNIVLKIYSWLPLW